MGILDKLRPQPRWKHADPAVRLEALPQIEDPAVLAGLAGADPDARVRRKALDFIDDVDVLAGVAARDADHTVQEAAAQTLVEIATDPETAEPTAVRAVAGLAGDRRLTLIARTSPHAQARQEALARVTEPKSLAAIARGAADERTALAAAGRLDDVQALVDVALNSAHKDVAMSAFERAIGEHPEPDLARLEQIAARAQQKTVARRAKAMLQAIADAGAARMAAEEERRKQQAAILESLDRIGAAGDWRATEAALARAREAWTAAGEGGDPRFDAAVAAAQARIAENREADAAARRREEERAAALAARDAICARIEAAGAAEDSGGETLAARLDAARSEWNTLPAIDGGADGKALDARFAGALALAARRHEQREAAAAAQQTLRAIAADAAALSGNMLDEALNRWKTLKRRWKDTEQTLISLAIDPPADAVEQFRAADDAIALREAAAREEKRKAMAERVSRVERLADRAERVSKAEGMTLREGERLLRDARAVLDEPIAAPRPDGYDDAIARLRGLVEQIAPRVRELRDLDEWRRFANAQVQEDLIRKADALAAELDADAAAGRESDLGKAAATLRDLQTKWKAAAEAPRDRAQDLWRRFRTPVDAVRGRCAVFFARQAEERAANLKARQALCERAEALADSTDWVKTAEAFRALQADWRGAGPIAQRDARLLWDRFRKASDRFFTRRRDDLASRKTVWAENLAKKEALCGRAEALAESSEWDTAAGELKRLQAEWKTIGPVRKSRSEAVWKRFRAAADRFFERYHNRHQAALEQKTAEREALVAELEALAGAEGDAEPDGLAARVQDLRAKLRVPAGANDAQTARVAAAVARAVERWPSAFRGTDLDPDAALKRMEKLCVRAEALAATEAEAENEDERPLSQAEALAARLRQALAANTFGGRAEDDRGPSLADQIRELQSAWQRLTVPAAAAARDLEARFTRAIATARDRARDRNELTRA